MLIEEYRRHDGVGLAALIAAGDVSAEEVRGAALAALAEADAAFNCLVELYPEPRAPAALSSGPLAGVPFVYKDAGAHEDGGHQELGSRLAAGLPAQGETFLARRFREAGLVNLGRTTTAEFTYGCSAETVAHGATRNPWDRGHTAGGSSGGSAAAVTAGAVPIAHATDGGGSIRIPAAWCGLVGLKPSRGRVSSGPGMGETLFGLATEHVLTRSVRDTACVLAATHGAMPGDPFTIPPLGADLVADLDRPPEPLRIGVVREPWTDCSAPDAQCLDAAPAIARLLEAAGHVVEPCTIAIDAEGFLAATTQIWCSQLAAWVGLIAAATGRDPATHCEPAIFDCYRYGRDLDAVALNMALLAMNGVCRAIGPLFERYDILVTPATARTAPPLGEQTPAQSFGGALEWTRHMFDPAPFTATFNTTGHPAIAIPASSHTNGLPIGVQLVARHGAEALLLGLARQIEIAAPWPTMPATASLALT